MMYPFGPKHLGGRGDLRPRIMEQVANGKPFDEATYEVLEPHLLTWFFLTLWSWQVLQTHTGELVKTIGMPPMYDHEFSPQAVRSLVLVLIMFYSDLGVSGPHR